MVNGILGGALAWERVAEHERRLERAGLLREALRGRARTPSWPGRLRRAAALGTVRAGGWLVRAGYGLMPIEPACDAAPA